MPDFREGVWVANKEEKAARLPAILGTGVGGLTGFCPLGVLSSGARARLRLGAGRRMSGIGRDLPGLGKRFSVRSPSDIAACKETEAILKETQTLQKEAQQLARLGNLGLVDLERKPLGIQLPGMDGTEVLRTIRSPKVNGGIASILADAKQIFEILKKQGEGL